MELTDLKKTWGKMASNRELDEKQLKAMLSKRTKNMIEQIERNIKIGFVILFGLFLLIVFDDYIISPAMLENVSFPVPRWLMFLGVFSNTLLFTTFIYFVIKYYRVKRSCDVICDLKDTLRKTIETLSLYQRLFYLALISLTVTMALGFIAGLYQESVTELQTQNIPFSEIQIDQLLLEIVIGLLFLIVAVGGIFVFLRWGFRRLYGNYCNKLKQTLKELNEIDE
jgi:hypothetical protein